MHLRKLLLRSCRDGLGCWCALNVGCCGHGAAAAEAAVFGERTRSGSDGGAAPSMARSEMQGSPLVATAVPEQLLWL